ncbi:hypothetical protein ZIOFF_050249 [Zingiber officinale]|uniref:Uncharacterized protein n=1 Tax=Zingiber officinale TaxID=94328 RepID=A0A8J5FPM7_ZINOF|nr:hypothetical protein ZIOFF_050249 [Zingiber officinale]
MALLVLIQFVFWAVGSLAGLLCFVAFRAAALLVVAVVQLLKLPRQASIGALDFVTEFLRSVLEQALGLLGGVVASVAKALFEAVASAVTGSVQLAASGAAGVLEKTRESLAGAAETLPQVTEAVSELVAQVANGMLSGWKDALRYVMENAFS